VKQKKMKVLVVLEMVLKGMDLTVRLLLVRILTGLKSIICS